MGDYWQNWQAVRESVLAPQQAKSGAGTSGNSRTPGRQPDRKEAESDPLLVTIRKIGVITEEKIPAARIMLRQLGVVI